MIVVEPSGNGRRVAEEAIRRRIGDSFGLYVDEVVGAERHGRPDDERQGAAGGDEGAL